MDENQRRIMPKKITKKQIYNLKILQDLFKTCNDWKLEEIAKYSFLHINTINKLYDYLIILLTLFIALFSILDT